jgi:hypothetical protein
VSGIDDLEQPAKSWIADAIEHLVKIQAEGNEPTMDLIIGEHAFEFKFKAGTPDDEVDENNA